MKTTRRLIGGLVTLLFIGANITGYAQTRVLASTKLVTEPVVGEIAKPDSVVRIVADAKELPLVSPDKLPLHGTYWVVTGGGSFVLPMPFISYDQANSPVYSLGKAGQFLVDATRGVAPQPTRKQADRGVTAVALLERQGSAILNLVEQVHAADLKAQQTAELVAMEVASGKTTTSGTMSRMSFSGMGGSQLNSQASQIDYGTNLGLEVLTNAPETLLFDTMSSSSNGVLASWRDVRTSPVPEGMALGILIATNCPFELTRIEAEVLLENPESLADTEFEVGFFRNTNKFAIGMYADPEYITSDVDGTLSKTLTDLGNGHWLLSVELPSYAWGTNRVVTIRTVPNSNGTMTKLSLIASSNTIPGITAYASDNTTTNMVQVALPKMQVWRRMISPRRSPSLAVSSYIEGHMEFDLAWLPGYQIGTSINLSMPFYWQTDQNWRAIVEANNDMGFFLARPDPTE